jgi:hypothetical protein
VGDSCGTSGTGETPNYPKGEGGSPPATRKASTSNGNQPLSSATRIARTDVAEIFEFLSRIVYIRTIFIAFS